MKELDSVRKIAKAISAAENGDNRILPILKEAFKLSGNAYILGVTGSPGAGKSTLVDQLALFARTLNKKVAVLAVDPSSPYTGGAILGDRIRMSQAASDHSIYIRSLASRGALGGLSRAVLDSVHILDAAGFDLIIVETVGVGQGEVDIVRVADTVIVTLVPGMGDAVQTFKAGIIEIADLFVINKSDREGADLLERDLNLLLSLGDLKGWKPIITRTIATSGEGIGKLYSSIEEHQKWLKDSKQGEVKNKNRLREKIRTVAVGRFLSKFSEDLAKPLEESVERCLMKKSDPYTEAEKLHA